MPRLLYSLIFVVIATTLTATQCEKDDYPQLPKQEFWEKIALTPYQKEYKTGDTIWLHYSTNDKTFFDTISNQRLSSSSLKFMFGAVLFPKYQTPDNPLDGYCTFVNSAGSALPSRLNESATTTEFDIDCDAATKYDFKSGVVLNYKGIYILQLPNAIPLQTCDGQPNPYPNASLHFTYNLPDCNKDVYLSIPAENRKEFPEGYTETGMDLKVSYAFQVN